MSFIAPHLEIRNFSTFNNLAADARTIIAQALKIDELSMLINRKLFFIRFRSKN